MREWLFKPQGPLYIQGKNYLCTIATDCARISFLLVVFLSAQKSFGDLRPDAPHCESSFQQKTKASELLQRIVDDMREKFERISERDVVSAEKLQSLKDSIEVAPPFESSVDWTTGPLSELQFLELGSRNPEFLKVDWIAEEGVKYTKRKGKRGSKSSQKTKAILRRFPDFQLSIPTPLSGELPVLTEIKSISLRNFFLRGEVNSQSLIEHIKKANTQLESGVGFLNNHRNRKKGRETAKQGFTFVMLQGSMLRKGLFTEEMIELIREQVNEQLDDATTMDRIPATQGIIFWLATGDRFVPITERFKSQSGEWTKSSHPVWDAFKKIATEESEDGVTLTPIIPSPTAPTEDAA